MVLDNKFALVYILLACMILMVSCITPKIRSTILVPAKYNEVANLRRIAVLPFTFNGKAEHNVTADIEALLTSTHVDGLPYFVVVERTQLRKVIDEQRLASSGLMDHNTAIKIGKIVGVQAVVFGAITKFGIDQTSGYETYRTCIWEDNGGKCKRWGNKTILCTNRTATFSFIPKFVNVSTGSLAMSEAITRQAASKDCGGMQNIANQNLLNTAKTGALEYFSTLISPHYITEQISLLSEDDSKPSEEIENKISAGISFAKAGRMDRACAFWEDAYISHKKGYLIPYLLGVCAEIRGNNRVAMDYYHIADHRTTRPVPEINDALVRIDQKFINRPVLDDQIEKIYKTAPTYSSYVEKVQRKLTALGYNPGSADGIMGTKTERAIKKYQRANSIPDTGLLDKATKRLLNAEQINLLQQ